MTRSTRRALCGILIAGGALAGTAVAATPDNGTVSKAAPKVTWAGQTIGSYFTRVPTAVSEDDSVPCEAPSCDSFALTVADSANLTVGADIVQPADNPGSVTLRIRKPDGSVIVGSSDASAVSEGKPYKLTIKNAPTGAYTVEYWNNFFDGPIDYNGFAELAVAAAPAPAPTPAGGGSGGSGGGGPSGGPAPTQAIDLDVSAGKQSARKLAKKRKLAAKVTVSREVSSISASFKKGSKTIGKGKRGTTSGTATLTVKLSRKAARKLKRGTYALVVSATDGSTSTTKTLKLKLGK